jgi:hypothetical protein
VFLSANKPETPARRWIFLAGLVFGAALSALFLTCGRSPRQSGGEPAQATSDLPAKGPLDDLVVGRVGKRKITPHDIDVKMKVQFSGMLGLTGVDAVRQRYEILRQMIDQMTWVDEGERKGYDKDEDFVQTLALSRAFILSNHTVDRMVYKKSEPTDQEIEKYYEDNADQFRLVARSDVSHILVASKAQAEALRRRALAGEEFAALAGQFSIDTNSKDVGGKLGTIAARSGIRGFSQEGTPLNLRLMSMAVGEVSEPINSERGWSIFKITSHTDASVQPLDEVREAIKKKLTSKKAYVLFDDVLSQVKKQVGVEIDQDSWMHYVLGRLNEDDAFRYIDGEKSARDKIPLYEALAEQVPKSPRAPQALFCAGYTLAIETRDYPKAREDFQRLISKFPGSQLVEPARWMIDNMEKGVDTTPQGEAIKRLVQGMASRPAGS